MRDITNEILELIRRTSSSLPKDVEDRLRASIEKEEPGSAARGLSGYRYADFLYSLSGRVEHA